MDLRKRIELLLICTVISSTAIMVGIRIGIRIHKQSLERQLSAAIARDDAATVISLADHGVTLHQSARRSSSLVTMACDVGAKHTLAALLGRGAVPGANDIYMPALHNDGEMVDTLIKAGASPNATAFGRFPVMITLAENRQTDMMKKLMRFGADPNVVYRITGYHPHGFTPLMVSVSSKDMASARALLQGGARADCQITDRTSDQEGYTALMIAEKRKEVDAVALLLEFGAKTDTVASDGMTPVALARQNVSILNLINKHSKGNNRGREASL